MGKTISVVFLIPFLKRYVYNEKREVNEMNYTYILQCSDGTYYTGWTNDIAKRLKTHNERKGCKIHPSPSAGDTGILRSV